MRRTHALTIVLFAAGLVSSCDDGGPSADRDDTDAGSMAASDAAGSPAPDAAVEAEPDAAASDAAATADAGVVPDAAPDAEVVDAVPPGPHVAEPLGRVYLSDPITDEGETTEVVLPETTGENGRLTNGAVAVFNCLNEEGGLQAMPDLGGFQITVKFCHEVQTAQPGPEGDYLQYAPPDDPADPNDTFAEVQMYYQVNQIHDYFKSTHGFNGLDYPLPALVNVQFTTVPRLPIPGFEPGPDGWYQFPNAAFFPKESWDELASQFGLPSRDSDTIIFGQAAIDFSYDARVIFHEYTHAVIGTDRLQARLVDRFGLDDSPRAMNEGLADYFAATLADDPVIGRFGIGSLQPALVRDVSQPRRCPDDLADEVHADGKIIGSATWALREALGAEQADAIIWGAIEQFTPETSLEVAGQLILAEAVSVGEGTAEQTEAILREHGVIGCERARPYVAFAAETSREHLPYVVEGTSSVGLAGFDEWVPGYAEFAVDVPEGTRAVTLEWAVESAGLLPGLPNGTAALEAAIRVDAPVEIDPAHPQTLTADAIAVPAAGADVPTRQRVRLTGACLPEASGQIYVMFLNRDDLPASIVTMARALHEDVPDPEEGVTVVDCAGD